MKYFGEYLVSKGLISEDVLLQAILQQTKSQLSIFEIVYKSKLLTDQQVLQVLKAQYERRIEFKAACESLGLWSQNLEAKVQKEIDSNHTPLGMILVKSGALDLTRITKALDEFLADVELPSKSSRILPVSNATSEIAPALVEEFTSHVNQSRMDLLISKLNALKGKKGEDAVLSLQGIISDIHRLRGLFRSIKLDRIDEIFLCLEQTSSKTLTLIQREEYSLIDPFVRAGILLCENFEKFLNEFAQIQSESAWFSKQENLDAYNTIFSHLNEIK